MRESGQCRNLPSDDGGSPVTSKTLTAADGIINAHDHHSLILPRNNDECGPGAATDTVVPAGVPGVPTQATPGAVSAVAATVISTATITKRDDGRIR